MTTEQLPRNRRRRLLAMTLAAATLTGIAACGDDTGDDGGDSTRPVTITLLAYDSYEPTPGLFDDFTARTGITVEIARAGDAGEMVSKAVLTAGNPEGDVMWGVDNTLLSRAVDGGVFTPYAATGLDRIPADLRSLVPGAEATPVDQGFVCVNADLAALEERDLAVPASFEDLADPRYRNQLVVQSPATSSPGLAFMLGTIAYFGTEGDAWLDYWRSLRANGVQVVDGWSQAYYGEFTRAGGSRSLVVSYASSPPAEVLFAEPPLPEGAPAPTTAVPTTCFQQIEFAGVLRGTKYPDAAKALIDELISVRVQEDLPLTLFVEPVVTDATLPDVFVRHTVRPQNPLTLDPAAIAANRTAWIDAWTSVVLR
jgi:thiamine transport system substrate-binding protein